KSAAPRSSCWTWSASNEPDGALSGRRAPTGVGSNVQGGPPVKDGQLLVLGRGIAASTVTLALLAGFVASLAMVLAFAIAFAAALVLGRLPVPILASWFQGLTNNPLIDTAGPNLYAATAIFFIGGLIWALLYGLVFEPRLRG